METLFLILFICSFSLGGIFLFIAPSEVKTVPRKAILCFILAGICVFMADLFSPPKITGGVSKYESK